MTEEEIFDDIAARISALEFMMRFVLSERLRAGSNDPAEEAFKLQVSAAARIRQLIDEWPVEDEKDDLRRMNSHVARIFEDLLRGIEADKR